MPDHIHLFLSIPPKLSVANTVGFIKGKGAKRTYRQILGTKKMTGLSSWAWWVNLACRAVLEGKAAGEPKSLSVSQKTVLKT